MLTPAVETARMDYVTESLDPNKAKMKVALTEAYNKATDDEKKIMKETLNTIGIETEEKVSETEKESIPEEGGDKLAKGEESEQAIEIKKEADDDGSDEMVKSLQEALTGKAELEERNKTLQEQLAVSDAKVSKLEEELGKYKSSTIKMSTVTVSNKELQEKVSSLEEELKAKTKTIESQKLRISKLVEAKKADYESSQSLNESVSKKDLEIKTLNENFDEIKKSYEGQIATLNESIANLKSDSESKDKEYCEKLTRANKLAEGYRKLSEKHDKSLH